MRQYALLKRPSGRGSSSPEFPWLSGRGPRAEFLDVLEGIYQEHGQPLPAWLHMARERLNLVETMRITWVRSGPEAPRLRAGLTSALLRMIPAPFDTNIPEHPLGVALQIEEVIEELTPFDLFACLSTRRVRIYTSRRPLPGC